MRLEWRLAMGRFLLGALWILVPTAASAAGETSVWVSTGTSVLYGGAQEIVWAQGNQVSYRESELDWSLKPLILADTGIGVAGTSGFRGNLEVRFAAPLPSGTITDSDFLNFDGVLTHFSQHDAYAERALFLDLDLGWEFPLRAAFSVTPFVSADVALLKLSARDGYAQYPPQATAPFTPWSPSTPKVSIYGTGIVYEQDTLAPAIGLRLSAALAANFWGTVSCAVTPFVWAWAVDNHLFRQIDFTSTLSNGFMIEPSLALEYKASRSTVLSLEVSYCSITDLVGDTTLLATGPVSSAWTSFFGSQAGTTQGPYPGSSGAGLSALTASLALKVSL